MDLGSVVTMDKLDAAVQAIEYREAFARTGEEPLRQIAEGYEALAEGVPLIDLAAAIRAAGVDANDRPRLAAVRADARVCFVARRSGVVEFRADWHDARSRSAIVTVPDFPGRNIWPTDRTGALVPIVPPAHRPTGRGPWRDRYVSLSRFVILWEVDEDGWQARDDVGRRRAPRDPALLRRVSGDLYAVLAVWDLTDLERLVLEGAAAR